MDMTETMVPLSDALHILDKTLARTAPGSEVHAKAIACGGILP
jgi:hypothetical protein